MDLLPTKNPKRTNCLLQQSRQWLENTVAIVSQGTFVDTIGQAKIIFDSYSYLQLGIRSYVYVIRWWFYISSAGWTMKENENSIEKNKASFWGVKWKPVFNSNTYRMPFQLSKIPVIAFEGCRSVEDGYKSPIVRSSSSLFTNLRLGSCQYLISQIIRFIWIKSVCGFYEVFWNCNLPTIIPLVTSEFSSS